VEPGTIVVCFECRQPIAPGEGFARFKMPGNPCYRFFHRRFFVGDCWEVERGGSNKASTGAALPGTKSRAEVPNARQPFEIMATGDSREVEG
jgi:hypothetical protein